MSLLGGGTGRLAVMISGPSYGAAVDWWGDVRLTVRGEGCRWRRCLRVGCGRGRPLGSGEMKVTADSYHLSFFGGGGLVGRASLIGVGGGPL